MGLTLLPFFLDIAGGVYFGGAIVLALSFQWFLLEFFRKGTRPNARRIVLASVFILPLVFILMVADKV